MTAPLTTDEKTQAIALANRLLDEPMADPDDDLRVLARQLLRSHEECSDLIATKLELQEQMRQLRKEHADEIRDMQRESRDIAAEAVWKERQGDDYGSY